MVQARGWIQFDPKLHKWHCTSSLLWITILLGARFLREFEIQLRKAELLSWVTNAMDNPKALLLIFCSTCYLFVAIGTTSLLSDGTQQGKGKTLVIDQMLEGFICVICLLVQCFGNLSIFF